jgi:uncharacterized small protein (DUF1192 family)
MESSRQELTTEDQITLLKQELAEQKARLDQHYNDGAYIYARATRDGLMKNKQLQKDLQVLQAENQALKAELAKQNSSATPKTKLFK